MLPVFKKVTGNAISFFHQIAESWLRPFFKSVGGWCDVINATEDLKETDENRGIGSQKDVGGGVGEHENK